MENELKESLEITTDTISKLNNVSKVLRGQSAKQEDRDKRRTLVLERASKTHTAFTNGFSTIDPSQHPDVLSVALTMLWEHFPRRPDLENKVGNADNPGDGFLYEQEHVSQARSVLQDLDQAWRNTESLANSPPPPLLRDMSKICLILTGMQKQHLLHDFLNNGISDLDLRLDIERLNEILKEEHQPYAALFYTEQYRAMPREWTEGSHEMFCEEEPMPLIYIIDEPSWGSFGSVMKVLDPFTGNIYARKQQIITSDMKLMQSARDHIQKETQSLKGLRHRHVVQFVKSYERGKVFGLVMKPAAHSDLGKLLIRYKNNKFYHRKDCKDSVWLRPVFHTAFGCLAQGLAYIHGRNLRHKDVKPDNILYEQPQASHDQPHASHNTYDRFLWADFGLAYDFSDKEDSKTRSTKLYSPRYAPPEVVAANAREKFKTVSNLHEIQEEGQVMIQAEINPQATDEEIDAHGRAADRFALGCIYLELLACLVKHDLPLKANQEKKVMFSNNIESLCAWADDMKKLDGFKELRPLFDIAVAMIARNPDNRLGINEVVHRVMKAGEAFSCQSCRDEYHSLQANTSEPSSPTAAVQTPPPTSPGPPFGGRRLSRINSGMSFSKMQALSPRASRKPSLQG